MQTTRERPPESARSEWGRWFSILGAPVAWAIQLITGSSVPELGCDAGGFGPTKLVISLVSVAAAIVAIAGLVLAMRTFRRDRGGDDLVAERHGFMAEMGMLSSGLFLIVIVVSGVLPQLYLPTCGR